MIEEFFFKYFRLLTILLGYLTGVFLVRLARYDVGLTLLAVWFGLAIIDFWFEGRWEKEALGDYE